MLTGETGGTSEGAEDSEAFSAGEATAAPTSVTQALDAVPGLLAWHRRILARGGSADVLDHPVASRAGGFLIEEGNWPGSFSIQDGSLVRHRMGPGGQWARGTEDTRLDSIRRTAEAVESIIGRPVEPVLVLTGGTTAFAGPVQIRSATGLRRAAVSARAGSSGRSPSLAIWVMA